jgi:protein phosphatase
MLMPVDQRAERGPFDIIGDVHGCLDELLDLLLRLGYQVAPSSTAAEPSPLSVIPPEGRRVVFLGDLVDRGPKVVEVVGLAMAMCEAGAAFCVQGNHDAKLVRALRGRSVRVAHGLQQSLEQLAAVSGGQRARIAEFLDRLPSHLVLDSGNLVAAHAGMKEELQGLDTAAARAFALYGETTGEVDEYGLPVRCDWAANYHGGATVVYGHTPVANPTWVNRTINIDTGCVFGGRLTALRYPERDLVSVPARQAYYYSPKPLV